MSSFVFIDSRVEDLDSLLAGLAAGVQAVVLDSTRDGVTQIAAALEGEADLDSIHIVSHGSSGTLYLGSTVLTEENLEQYQPLLAEIGASLSEAGDLLLYGCDVGAGTSGQRFIASLAARTGADVAASTDTTGSPLFGANWLLEAATGAIEAPASFSAQAQNAYTHTLGAPTPPVAGALVIDFADGGYAHTPIGLTNSAAYALGVQADGRIVVGGYSTLYDFVLARYNVDGSADASFGNTGQVSIDMGGVNYVSDIALRTDGSVVAVGYAGDGLYGVNGWTLAHLESNGSLDSTFGSNGRAYSSDPLLNEARAVTLQPDGKPVVVGAAQGGSLFGVARYDALGQPDPAFAGDGEVTANFAFYNDVANSVAVQADGKILVVGYSKVNEPTIEDQFVVARFNANGTLDASFGSSGHVFTSIGTWDDHAYDVAVQSDGKIVVVGFTGFESSSRHPSPSTDVYSSAGVAVARYNDDGSLDTDTPFGTNGTLIADFETLGFSAGYSVAIQADGKIVIAGQSMQGDVNSIGLMRLNPDGSFDTTFDGDGRLTTDFGGRGLLMPHPFFLSEGASVDVAVMPDGRIVASGSAHIGSQDFVAIARYLPDGSLDTSLDQDGMLTDTLGAYSSGLALAMTVQEDGRIVLVGGASNGTDLDFAIARFMPDGNLDTSLDGDGTLLTDMNPSSSNGGEALHGVASLPDGRILGVGVVGGQPAVVRYNPDGNLDPSFDADGIVSLPLSDATGPALQQDGKAIIAGGTGGNGSNFALLRLNADGSLDTSFGAAGIARTDFGEKDEPAALIIQPDGKIVVAGSSTHQVYVYDWGYEDYIWVRGSSAFAVARYDPDGSLDTSFGTQGTLTTSIGSKFADPTSIALQADGKIVVAGNVIAAGSSYSDFALVRYNANGSLDTTFDFDGVLTTAIGRDDYCTGVAVQPDGKIVAAGHTWNGSKWDIAVVRYNPDGSLDASFDGDGKLVLSIGAGVFSSGIALAPNGDILIGGETSIPGSGSEFVLMRIHGSGTGQTLTGTADPDTMAGGSDNDSIAGRGGDDNIVTGSGNDSVLGEEGNDWIHGNANNDTLFGGLGNDELRGGNGDDYLQGNQGNDTLIGSLGNDELRGGNDDDYVQGNQGNDTIFGSVGNDELRGGNDNDFVQGNQGNDTIFGSLGNDELRGGNDNDYVQGNQGNDTLFGSIGNDELRGGNDDDLLLAGEGNDTLIGSFGNDLLTAGPGLDQFWFNSAGAANADTITDFGVGGEADTLVLAQFVFTALMPGALAATSFVAGPGREAADADDYILYDSGTGNLFYDADGNGGGASQLIATLTGAPSLTAGDFLIVA